MSIRETPTRARIRRTPESARDNILAAAEALLVERGPKALKLADVAAAAGVANATVLHHFGSIDGVQSALMERMIEQLVDDILTASAVGDDASKMESSVQALFDAFERRGAARLAAWLELSGESRRLTSVRQAVQEVVANRIARAGVTAEAAENLVLVSVVLAMGAGLFGRSLAELVGRPADTTRRLATEFLYAHARRAGGQTD